MQFAKVLVVVVLLSEPLFGQGCGDGGPSPLIDLSDPQTQVSLLPSIGGIREFTRWEHKDSVVYRSTDSVLYQTSGKMQPKQIAKMNGWLSRVTDEKNSYVLQERPVGVLRPEVSPEWKTPPGVPLDAEPVFVRNDKAYFVRINNTANPTFDVYQYHIREGFTYFTCRYPGYKNRYYRMGDGHSYPNAVLWDLRKSVKGYHLSTVALDVERCAGAFQNFVDPFVGPITNITYTKNPTATLVELNHKTHRIAWWAEGYPCRYYDTRGAKPMALDTNTPFIATFSAKEGLHLVDLRSGERRRLLRDLPITDVDLKTIHLDKDGKTLHVAPTIDGAKSLLRINLEN